MQHWEHEGQFKFYCHFGPEECIGNKIHACSIKYITNQHKLADYIHCMIRYNGQLTRRAEQCSQTQRRSACLGNFFVAEVVYESFAMMWNIDRTFSAIANYKIKNYSFTEGREERVLQRCSKWCLRILYPLNNYGRDPPTKHFVSGHCDMVL